MAVSAITNDVNPPTKKTDPVNTGIAGHDFQQLGAGCQCGNWDGQQKRKPRCSLSAETQQQSSSDGCSRTGCARNQGQGFDAQWNENSR